MDNIKTRIEKYCIPAAHIIKDDEDKNIVSVQSIKEHCTNVSELARAFAERFGAGDAAALCGLAHDIGKYSDAFQKRIWEDGPKVDHSTAGAVELRKLQSFGFPCVAGHHAGLSDLQTLLTGRLKNKLPDYSAFLKDLELNAASDPAFAKGRDVKYPMFAGSFYIRMLFSCLVDADYLDTEQFMGGGKSRVTNETCIEELYELLDTHIKNRKWLEGKSGINYYRSMILKNCIKKGEESNSGIYTLTVPTGGGKTAASLAFALNHARRNHMERVIYVVPYCAIIDQTVDVYSEILGPENILAHYSEAGFEDDDTKECKNSDNIKKLAAENWDMPVIITTAVQFFESLFSNRTSKCRKLHNIANSVIVFDEAQTIPADFLRPCVYAITELALHYHSTCVLCTATQPSLEKIIREYNEKVEIKEICDGAEELYEKLKRVTYENLGKVTEEELIKELEKYKQVLCIVATRAQARKMYELLPGGEKYHLSTWMTPEHRKATIDVIKRKLKAGEACRVISTSLIEAGVDFDFPIVFRAQTGLDSIIQAGGRCNREGNSDANSSKVFIFRMQGMNRLPAAMKLPGEITGSMMRMNGDIDLASPKTIKEYFDKLHYNRGAGLDCERIVEKLSGKPQFKEVASRFKLIENYEDKTIFIPRDPSSCSLADEIRRSEGIMTRDLYRRAGKYCVSVTSRIFNELRPALEIISEEFAILAVSSNYNDETGLSREFEGGEALLV